VIFVRPEDGDVDIGSMGEADLLAFAEGEGSAVRVIHAMELTDDLKRQYRRIRRH